MKKEKRKLYRIRHLVGNWIESIYPNLKKDKYTGLDLDSILNNLGISKDDFFARSKETHGDILTNFLGDYFDKPFKTSPKRLGMICKFSTSYPDLLESLLGILKDFDPSKEVFLWSGKSPKYCRSKSYNVSSIRKSTFEDIDELEKRLGLVILKEFRVGNIYRADQLKDRLQEIFDDVNYPFRAKATLIQKWFDTKYTEKRIKGRKFASYKLLDIK